MGKATLTGMALLCLAATACSDTTARSDAAKAAADAAAANAALTALADRLAIQNLAVRYVSHLGGQNGEAFGEFFTDDAVFDVNGAVYTGKKAIVGLYSGMRSNRPADAAPDANGLAHMLLTNPVIEVNGDTATASYIWTGVMNPKDLSKPPIFLEQGREYDLYVKQADGKWLIKKRTVIADSPVPKGMLNTWKRRLDYDITKD
jgi:ketosteroid isomerase-like protein